MTAFTGDDHVTEREPGRWEDCLFASMLETIRLAKPGGRSIPATITEVNLFRRAAGYPDSHGGVTIEDALPAATRRYGLTARDYEITALWSDVRYALTEPSTVAVVNGLMAVVPSYLRRHDPGFSGAHSVAARGDHFAPIWCDPLAPKGAYHGEPVSLGVWETFFGRLPGARALLMTVREEDYCPMPIYTQEARAGSLKLPAHNSLRAWEPAADKWVVAKVLAPMPTPWTARFDAVLKRIGGDTKPTSLLRVSSGGLKGLYISTADVAETFD